MNFFYPCVARKSKAGVLSAAAGALLAFANADAAQSVSYTKADVTFRTGDLHTHKVMDSRGTAIAETDIILGASADFFNTDGQRTTRGLSNKSYGRIWPNGLVPYRISEQLSSTTQRRVRDAVEHWNSFQAITLVERTDSNASAYPDFVDFVKDDRCASWIGYQGNGAQSIYTGANCSTGTMIHEIGHALGLLHEHTRSDRDQYVTIHWESIDEDMHINFEIMQGNIQLGQYDYASIMHYGEYFFSNNGSPTIVPLQQTGATLGQRIETSPGDRAAVAELYKSNNSLIAISSENTTVGSATEVEFLVSNNTSVGSHTLDLTVQVPADSRLLSYSSANWMCAQPLAGNDVTCTTPVLPANAQSKVVINLQAALTPGLMQLDAQLTSRSLDTDLSDNHDSASIKVVEGSAIATSGELANTKSPDKLQIASAMDASSAGGGSADLQGLALLAMFLCSIAWYQHRTTRIKTAPAAT